MKLRRYLLLGLGPLALILSALLVVPGPAAPHVVYGADAIPGRYIVVLKQGVDATSASTALGNSLGFQPDTVYSAGLRGFAAEMSPQQAQALAGNSEVSLVTADQYVHADIHLNPFQTLPTGIDRVDADHNSTANITGQNGATPVNADVAVIDTGALSGHVDLNVAGGVGFSGPGCSDEGFEDDNGHGTHVSGTIAAKDDAHGVVGMAPGARVWAVKVLDGSGSGSNSCVIRGIEWVADRRAEFNDGPGDGDPGIDLIAANMSLGGASGAPPDSDPMCQAINDAVSAGVMIAVAAGNSFANASNFTPAKCTNAITVSAYADFDGQPGGLSNDTMTFASCNNGTVVQQDDTFACFSNFGPSVDIAAPGVKIMSTYPGPADQCDIASCYAEMSGTSMATPHVTGALLLLHLATGYNGPADASHVMAAMTAAGYTRPQNSTCGFTGDPDNFPEPVLFVGSGCSGGSTATPTHSPSPTPTPTPTPTPSPTPTPHATIHHPTFTPTPGGLQGDVDCDGRVSGADSLAILAFASESSGPTTSCLGLADVNCDGRIDATDALLVLKYLSGQAPSVSNCPAVGTSV